jgi:hypothetical protein
VVVEGLLRSLVLGSALVAAFAGPPAAAAATARLDPAGRAGGHADCDCAGLRLKTASGVPDGGIHRYRFEGVCALIQASPPDASGGGAARGPVGRSDSVETVAVVAEATWNAANGELEERLAVQGAYPGEVTASLRCASDPVLTDAPCTRVSYANTTGWAGFDRVSAGPRPLTAGRTTLAAASALSRQNDSAAAPAPGATPKPEAGWHPAAGVVLPGPIALVEGARVALADGRALVGRTVGRIVGRDLVWVLVSAGGETLEVFPAGSRAVKSESGAIVVGTPHGPVRLGR